MFYGRYQQDTREDCKKGIQEIKGIPYFGLVIEGEREWGVRDYRDHGLLGVEQRD